MSTVSRAFGDLVAKRAGVIAEPQVTDVTLTTEDAVLIIASDGLVAYLINIPLSHSSRSLNSNGHSTNAARRQGYGTRRTPRRASLPRPSLSTTCPVSLPSSNPPSR